MKHCTKCGVEKLETCFNVRSDSEKLKGTCKECVNKNSRKDYILNKHLYIQSSKLRTKIRKKDLRGFINVLKDNPCVDCHVKYPACVMDFDHIKIKTFSIANVCRHLYSNYKILKEIEKCELVCANCHRIRTFIRRGENHGVLT